MPRNTTLIVIHCSATANGGSLVSGTVGQPGFKTPADTIDGWHRERGFKRSPLAAAKFNPKLTSIGYHFVIGTNGALFTGRGLDEVGAHVADHNSHSIGICMVGTDKFTHDQWDALAQLVHSLSKSQGIPLLPAARFKRLPAQPDTLTNGLCGHRDLSKDLNGDGKITSNEWTKLCPGFDVATWLKQNEAPLQAHLLPGGTSK